MGRFAEGAHNRAPRKGPSGGAPTGKPKKLQSGVGSRKKQIYCQRCGAKRSACRCDA